MINTSKNSNIIVLLIIIVLVYILIYILSIRKKENILACSANCSSTEILTKDDEDTCLNCKFCGICTTESGDKTCVNGTKEKPLFGADCIDWKYNYGEDIYQQPINFENKNETDYGKILQNLNQTPITKPTKSNLQMSKRNKDITNYEKILKETDLSSNNDLDNDLSSQKQLDNFYKPIIKYDTREYKQYYNLLEETCKNFDTLKQLSDIDQFKLDK